MSKLFPHNQSDPNILNQPEEEYRKAKYAFKVRHRYIEAKTGEHKYMDSSHCPVCFWNPKYDFWTSVIGKRKDSDVAYCRLCGQKVIFDEEEADDRKRLD